MPHQAILLPLGDPFIELTTVDSTNNYAMAQLQTGVISHGTAYFAHQQTAGKGQRGKSWITDKGENILLSMVLQPSYLKPGDSFILSALIANACYDFFKTYAGHETRIKWPNDIYWRDRKTGGVLIENIIRNEKWNYSIVGIGININQTKFVESVANAASLRQITGESYDPVCLAKELCGFLTQHYKNLAVEQDKIIESYNRNLYKLNLPVKLRKGNIVFETTIRGVTPQGKLMTYDVMPREFDFGEIEWILGVQ